MAAAALSLCNSDITHFSTRKHNPLFVLPRHKKLDQSVTASTGIMLDGYVHQKRKTATIVTATEGSSRKSNSKSEEPIPSWAKPDSEEPPPWDSKNEQGGNDSFEAPFFVYLIASAITAIAAIGSAFEYVNQKPVFGILNSDSIFYAPVLGFFAFTGIPTSAFLWYKSVETANKESEEQDKKDGYL